MIHRILRGIALLCFLAAVRYCFMVPMAITLACAGVVLWRGATEMKHLWEN